MADSSDKNTILFVDDEERVLSGIKRLLHHKTDQWNMDFVTSGQIALKKMQETDVDIVVTDIYMPNIDGIDLLKKIKSEYPRVFRIGLSGNADKQLNLTALHLVHQYLPKPCKKDTIVKTLTRSLALKNIIEAERIREIISQLNTLPSLPAMYNEIISKVNNEKSSIREIGKIVARDISMSTKVLQMINSAYFGLRNKVTDPVQAVVYLGLETIKSLVLTVKIFDKFKEGNVSDQFINDLWNHSLNVAKCSQNIAKDAQFDRDKIQNFWTAGLLHDIGKLVIAANFPEDFKKIEKMVEQGKNLLQAEKETIGANHSEIGAYLLALWGLPTPLISSCAFHHSPDRYNSPDICPVNVIHFTNALDRHNHKSEDNEDEEIPFNREYFESVGLAGQVQQWTDIGRETLI